MNEHDLYRGIGRAAKDESGERLPCGENQRQDRVVLRGCRRGGAGAARAVNSLRYQASGTILERKKLGDCRGWRRRRLGVPERRDAGAGCWRCAEPDRAGWNEDVFHRRESHENRGEIHDHHGVGRQGDGKRRLKKINIQYASFQMDDETDGDVAD